jgi:microcompartment protein CcmL/EutN
MGPVSHVEAAVEQGKGALERPELLVREVVIPQLFIGVSIRGCRPGVG